MPYVERSSPKPRATAGDQSSCDRQRAFMALLDDLERQADEGFFVSEAAMTAWFDSLDDDPDAPPPPADIRLR